MKIKVFKRIIKIHLGTRCDCNKYSTERFRGIICEKCGAEVRRDRIIKIDRSELNKEDFKEIIYSRK